MDLTAKHFQNHLLRVLGAMTAFTEGSVVLGEDTYHPVAKSMGFVDLDALGMDVPSQQPKIVKLIQAANNNLRDTGFTERKGRGRWTLTGPGVDEARRLTSTVLATVTTAAPEVKMTSLIPTVTPPIQVMDCLDDPYILGLVVRTTACFGHYTNNRKAECATCPLARFCQGRQYANLAKQVSQLETEDMATRLGAGKPAATPAPPAAAPTGRPPKAEPDFSKMDVIRAFDQCECTACQKPIMAGDLCRWHDDGQNNLTIYHIDCSGGK